MPSENLPLKRFYRRYTVKMFRCLFSYNCSRAAGSKITTVDAGDRRTQKEMSDCPGGFVFVFSVAECSTYCFGGIEHGGITDLGR